MNAGGDLDLDMSQFPVKLEQEDPAINIAFNAFNQNKFDFFRGCVMLLGNMFCIYLIYRNH